MLKNQVSIAVASLLFLVGCSKNPANQIKERAEIRNEWFEDTKKVVEKIKDEQASEVFRFAEENSVLGAPDEKGVKFLEQGKSKQWFTIIPFLNGDENVSDHWKQMQNPNAAARFLPGGTRALLLENSASYSPTTKAIIFLHEGAHAYIYVHNPYDGVQNNEEYSSEEMKVHTFQNKIMSLLGGKKYQEVLDFELARINAKAKYLEGKLISVPDRSEYNEGLAEAFEQPASQVEKDFIQTSVWIHSVFTFFDQNFKIDSEKRKAFFLLSIYKKGGVLH